MVAGAALSGNLTAYNDIGDVTVGAQSDADMTGRILTECGSIGDVTVYGRITEDITACGSIAGVETLDDIEGNIIADGGELSVMSLGGIDGNVLATNDVFVAALNDITGDITSVNGNLGAESWGSISGQIDASSSIYAWAKNDITSNNINSSLGTVELLAENDVSGGNITAQGDIDIWAGRNITSDIASSKGGVIAQAWGNLASNAITAEGDINAWANKNLSSNITSQGSIIADGWTGLSGSIVAGTDADLFSGQSSSARATSVSGSITTAAWGVAASVGDTAKSDISVLSAKGFAGSDFSRGYTPPATGSTTTTAPAPMATAPATALPWSIKRSGQSTAVATSQSGDTIADLAVKCGLDAVDFGQWLTAKGTIRLQNGSKVTPAQLKPTDKLAGGQTFGVPNIVMDVWLGWGSWFGKFGVGESGDINDLKSMGFDVEVHDLDKAAFTPDDLYRWLHADSVDKSLQGFIVTGHGNAAGFFTASGTPFAGYFSDVKNSLQYNLGLVILNICEGGWSVNDPNNPVVIPDSQPLGGRDIVSQNAVNQGFFYGIKGTLVPPFLSKHPGDLLSPGAEGTNPPPPATRLYLKVKHP